MSPVANRIVLFAQQQRKNFEGMTPLQRKALILGYLANVGVTGMANWCAAFTSFVVYLATGSEPGPSPKSAGARQWGRRALRLGWKNVSDGFPQPGDVWIWWRVSPAAWQGHIGIVVEVSMPNTHTAVITTLEGNSGGKIAYRKYDTTGAALGSQGLATQPSRRIMALRHPNA